MKTTAHDFALQYMRDHAAANNITWAATRLGWRAKLRVPGGRRIFDSETEYGALKRAFDEVNKNMPCIQRSSLIEQQAQTTTASLNEIYDGREVVAQAEWESYDLGNYECEDCSGWEWTIPGNTMTRPIFLAGQEDEPSIAAQFTVEFKDGTAEIINAYASCDGETIGQRANQNQVKP
jgi:hypothetical protein